MRLSIVALNNKLTELEAAITADRGRLARALDDVERMKARIDLQLDQKAELIRDRQLLEEADA